MCRTGESPDIRGLPSAQRLCILIKVIDRVSVHYSDSPLCTGKLCTFHRGCSQPGVDICRNIPDIVLQAVGGICKLLLHPADGI